MRPYPQNVIARSVSDDAISWLKREIVSPRKERGIFDFARNDAKFTVCLIPDP